MTLTISRKSAHSDRGLVQTLSRKLSLYPYICVLCIPDPSQAVSPVDDASMILIKYRQIDLKDGLTGVAGPSGSPFG